MNQNIFKAYDIRGKYPVEINEEIADKIISSFISKIKNHPAYSGTKIKIIVGRDARLSSPMLYQAAIKSIKRGASGIKIIEAGLMTTPMLYFLVNHFKTDLGIMITASHNPKEYNGLKIVGKNAIPISGEEIYKIVMKYATCDMRHETYIKIYADFLGKFLKPQKRLSAIFDCSNGTAGIVLKKIFKNYKLINFISDGNFPAHGPNPLEKGGLDELCSAVKKHRADLGVIFDADADRVFFVDDLGRFVNPDVIARLLIWHLKPKKAIIDIRAGRLIKKLKIKNQKSKIFESRVGHYFIKKLMRKTKADFAAEYSGHYYFKKFFYADDGILAAIETINAVSKLPYKLSDFIDLLPQYYRSGELNFKVADKENLMKIIEKKYEVGAKIIKLDGLTMEFSDWQFNLRPSNTEPLVRLNIETASKKILKQKIRELKKIIISS